MATTSLRNTKTTEGVQVSTNPPPAKTPKNIKDVTAYCSSLEGMLFKRLDDLQAETNRKLGEMNIAISSKIEVETASDTKQTNFTTLTVDIAELQQKLENQISAVREGMKLELETLRSQLERIDTRQQDQEDRMDEAEQYSRRNCLLIHGIPERPGENVVDALLWFSNTQLKFNLPIQEVDRCHRLGPVRKNTAQVVAAGHPRPIIVKLTRYYTRAEMWGRKVHLRNTGYFLTESLTRKRAALLKRAKEIAPARNVWTQDGRITVLGHNNRRIYINYECDMVQLDDYVPPVQPSQPSQDV